MKKFFLSALFFTLFFSACSEKRLPLVNEVDFNTTAVVKYVDFNTLSNVNGLTTQVTNFRRRVVRLFTSDFWNNIESMVSGYENSIDSS